MSVALKRMGQFDLHSLEAVSERCGRDFMPYPLMHTRPGRFDTYDEYTAHAADVCARFDSGAMGALRTWFDSYLGADLRVECMVSFPGLPNRRLLAHRIGDQGFLAIQQTDDDVVDVYSLSPYELGAAIARSVPLTKPGKHSVLEIPGLVRPTSRVGDAGGEAEVSIHHRVETRDAVAASRAAVAAYTRVQSRRQPARDPGFDREKNIVVWVRIADDGDYVYRPGFTHLSPMTVDSLTRRIDELVAEDVAAIRMERGRG